MLFFIIQGDEFGALRITKRKGGGTVEGRRVGKESLGKWQKAEYWVLTDVIPPTLGCPEFFCNL